MHDIQILTRNNVERIIQLALDRAEAAGAVLDRNQVLEHLKFSEDEDVSQWESMVDSLIAEHNTRFAA